MSKSLRSWRLTAKSAAGEGKPAHTVPSTIDNGRGPLEQKVAASVGMTLYIRPVYSWRKVFRMCIHYEALKNPKRYQQAFNVAPPSSLGKGDMWPKYTGVFIRRPPETDPHDEAVPEREAVNGRWGLVPWATNPASADVVHFSGCVAARSTLHRAC